MMVTPLTMMMQEKLKNSELIMETPLFVTTAAEWLRNKGESLHPENYAFLAVRVENDTKVL